MDIGRDWQGYVIEMNHPSKDSNIQGESMDKLENLSAEMLASADDYTWLEMKERAIIACCFRNNSWIQKNRTKVTPNTIVVHAGARIKVSIEEGSPGHGAPPLLLEPKAEGWTCNDIVGIRSQGEKDHLEELIASTPGATNAEFTLNLESYETEEVHFTRGHQVWFEDQSCQRECPVLRNLSPKELANEKGYIRTEMKRRAATACWFGGRGHLEGFPNSNGQRPEKGTVVKPDSVVVHAGARVKVRIREGSPGYENGEVIFQPKEDGWTCSEIVQLRGKGQGKHIRRLIASNPGSTCVEFTLRLESYTTEEVHFSQGHQIYNDDVEDYGDVPPPEYKGPINV